MAPDYEPFRSQFLGLLEQILSLNISAHGSKFRKNDSVPNEGYQELCFDIDISLFPTTSFSGWNFKGGAEIMHEGVWKS